jgi:hypothetical protein
MVEAPVKDGVETDIVETDGAGLEIAPTAAQRGWLVRGLEQPGGKLPLFDRNGQRVSRRTIKSCLEHGWAAPWFSNPLKPDWLVCKLTPAGRKAVKPR